MTTKTFDKNILLCVAGMTPQIITETLYALTQDQEEPIHIDQIVVITTLTGREKIVNELLDSQNGQFYKFCDDYSIDPLSITFSEKDIIMLVNDVDGSVMDDIRTTTDNDKAANQICEIVRSLTNDNNTRIFASIAGGRKTMSVYLTMGMQLYGRSWDRLSHVLVNKEFEALHGLFYYIPPKPRNIAVKGPEPKTLSTADAQIHLAPIPFLRLRDIVKRYDKDRNSDLADLVLRTQSDLDLLETPKNLIINTKERIIEIGDRRTERLTPLQLVVYMLFALYRKGELSGDASNAWRRRDQITKADLDYICRIITKAKGEEFGLVEIDKDSKIGGFLVTMVKDIVGIQDSEREKSLADTIYTTKSKITNKLKKAGIPEKYHISLREDENGTQYALDIEPDKIVIL